jgi:hypothetical protein
MKTVLLAIVLSALYGCTTDNRQKIALTTLYGTPITGNPSFNRPPDPIFSAALNAKFPQDTNKALVRDYVKSLGGNCYDRPASKPSSRSLVGDGENVMVCTFIEWGGFCTVTDLYIEVSVDGDLVKHITATHSFSAC